MPTTISRHDVALYRTAGAAMAAITVFAMVALAHHPAGGRASSYHESLVQMAAIAHSAAIVHGLLLAMFGIMAAAHAALAGLLGASRPAVRLGLTAYHLVCCLLGAAMLCDGFVAPQLARQFVDAGAVQAEQVYTIIAAIGILIQVLSKTALLVLGVALPAFGHALAYDRARLPFARTLALVGVLAGLLPAAYMVFGDVRLGPANLPMVFAVQGAWYLGAAGMLLFGAGRRNEARPPRRPADRHKPVAAQS